MSKFIKIDDYYIGANIYGIYCFMQIETLGEIYQLENENDLIDRFNAEDTELQIRACDVLEEDFLLYQDRGDLTELRKELIGKYNRL